MSGQLNEIIKAFRGLFQGIEGWMTQVVPECGEVCESDYRETELYLRNQGAYERRVERSIDASTAKGSAHASYRRPGCRVTIKAGSRATGTRLYADDFVAMLRELEWTIETRKVIVFPGDGASPLTRVEIDIKDPRDIPATADALAKALQECGLTLQAAYESGIPTNEIWLMFPESKGSTALVARTG